MTVEKVDNKNRLLLMGNAVSDGCKNPLKLQWQFAQPDAEKTLRLDSFDWRFPESIDHACLIKENPQRQVWRLTLNEKEYYIKLFFRNGDWWRIKRQFRGPVCLKEWQVAQYAAEHNINCVHAVAYAINSCSEGSLDSILVTAGIPSAVPLNDNWNAISSLDRLSRLERVDALEDALADLLAKAHHAGLSHTDLHPGNLLVQSSVAGRCSVYFVDLHGIRIGKTVSQSEAINNLAQLNQWFRKNATLTQRMRLLKRYMSCRRELSPQADVLWSQQTFKSWAKELDAAVISHAEKLFKSRDRRIMRRSRYFEKCTLPNQWTAHFYLTTKHPLNYATATKMDLSARDWKHAFKNPIRVFEEWCHLSLPIKRSRSSRVCRGTLKLGEGFLPVVAKCRMRKKFIDILWDCFRPSRALRAWKISYAMIHRGIPAAFPLAVMERRVGPFLSASIFITEDLAPAVHLMACLTNSLNDLSEKKQRAVKHVLSEQIASILKKMHRAAFMHRDLKATNILVRNMPFTPNADIDPETLRVVLVDTDSVIWKRKLTKADEISVFSRLAKSIAQVPAVSRTDRVRFLCEYLTRYGSGRPDWKSLWRKIAAKQ
jgi:tRNA A-37 threonylcarbamoyl transferase component Bud32